MHEVNSVCLCVRCCALQADSEQLKQTWLSAVQGSIDLAYRERDGQVTQVCHTTVMAASLAQF